MAEIGEKRQKTFLIIFVLVIVVTVGVLWRGFFVKQFEKIRASFNVPIEPVSIPEITIDFSLFTRLPFDKLQPFRDIPPLEAATGTTATGTTRVGRVNPFISY